MFVDVKGLGEASLLACIYFYFIRIHIMVGHNRLKDNIVNMENKI